MRKRALGLLLAVAVPAVGVVLLLLPALRSGGAPAEVAQAEVLLFHVRGSFHPLPLFEPIDAKGNRYGSDDLRACLELPGVADSVTLLSDPPQYEGRVIGRKEADSFESCVATVPGWSVTFSPPETRAGR